MTVSVLGGDALDSTEGLQPLRELPFHFLLHTPVGLEMLHVLLNDRKTDKSNKVGAMLVYNDAEGEGT